MQEITTTSTNNNNVQATDDEQITNLNVSATITNNSDANMFQTFLRMAVAMFLTVWAISQSLFINIGTTRLAITTTDSSSSSSLEYLNNLNLIMEEEEINSKRNKKKIKKRTKKKNNEEKNKNSSSSSFSSSSSSSRESSPDKKEEKSTLKIDSNLLHTDTMPKLILTDQGLEKKKDNIKEGETSKNEEEKISSTPDSPPIIIETVGVQMERRRQQQQAFEQEKQQSQQQNIPPPLPPFFMFKAAREIEELEEEEDNNNEEDQPMFGRLDVIAEEDSDELRSAQSSRASTARLHLKQQSVPSSPQQQQASENNNESSSNNKIPSHFKFLFERQQSYGNSSQSSGAKIVELSTPEDEEDEEKKIGPKIPKLDLEGISLETSEAEEDEQKTTREGISSPISDTDTIIINEEDDEEINKNIIENKELIEKKIEEDKKGKHEGTEEENKMFSSAAAATTLLYQNPSDADRDQGEVFASLADQHIPMPPPMEDGHLSSPSMSINLDRSRESLDHSICSIPTKEIEIQENYNYNNILSPILSSSSNNYLNNTTNNGKLIGEEKDFDLNQINIAANTNGMLLNINGIGGDNSSKRQSEKASSTSSSSPAYIRKADQEILEEEDEPMPLPPPPPPTTITSSNLLSNTIKSSSSLFPTIQKQQEPYSSLQHYSHQQQQQPPPLPTLPPVSSPESVLPLWGRNEKLTNYLHGYGTTTNLLLSKINKERKHLEDDEGKENGGGGILNNINNYVQPPPTYNKWLENERKNLHEKHKEEDRAWTIHPITLKDDYHHQYQQQRPPSSKIIQEENNKKSQTTTLERNIPIKIHSSNNNSFSASNDLFNSNLWPQYFKRGYDGFQHSMSSSDLPPFNNLMQQQPPSSLYGGSSAKPSPIPTTFASIGAFDHSFETSSRSDFMSAIGGGGIGSSSTTDYQRTTGRQSNNNNIREIPIQRSASAFAPSIMTNGGRPPLTSATTAATQPPPSGHEYYRREVLTRTLVTRSTEALSAPPPLSRSPLPTTTTIPQPPPPLRPLDVDLPPRDQLSEEYWVRYSRNIEEEERRLRLEQEHRRREEEERRFRVEEQRRRLEQQEQELIEKLRRERELLGKTLEAQMIDRERAERDKIHQDRLDREAAERRRREEWDRIERERRAYEEKELEKRRELEKIEKERLERERLEQEKLERERLERQKKELERIEKQRLEHERIERERLEIERLEIERIERIKHEKREQEEREKERQRIELLKLQKVREDLEKAERERIELEKKARELYEREQFEEYERQKEREKEALNEAKRKEEERLAKERLEKAERDAIERELKRRAKERLEQEKLDFLKKEKERIEQEQLDAERRERDRLEQERKEKEMIEAAILARERRDQERREERERERQRQEEERLEQERRQRERIEAQQRERERQMQEQQERDRLAQLEAIAAERRAHRALEERQQRERLELERRAEELKEIERLEQERRERERTAEELRLAELREQEQKMALERERERREAQEREQRRQREGWRSREMLEQLARERDEKAAWEAEKRRLLEEHEIQERKRQGLTSKETLERLTRRPYYSRENLTLEYPDITTKVERQVIERVDRTLWSDTVDTVRPSSHNSLQYYGGGGSNLPQPFYSTTDHPLPPPTSSYQHQQQYHPQQEGDDFNIGRGIGDRLYQPNRGTLEEQEWLRRGGSSRTSKYRQKMEKARKEFITGIPSNEDPLFDRYNRKSTEDLFYGKRPPSEYRGPLLQRFNSGEFSHQHPPEPIIGLTSGLGRSPYEQEDLNRSKSALDAYSPTTRERLSRREYIEQESSHIRSKSADYLMDPRRPREEQSIPENNLQKGLLGEHELRFRKSTERMQVPDWYKDYYYKSNTQQQQNQIYGGPPSATNTSGVFSSATTTAHSTGLPYTRQQQEPLQPISTSSSISRPLYNYSQQQQQYYPLPSSYQQQYQQSPPPSSGGGISFPIGMFDKYKDEIEDLRRSRGSLHQLSVGVGGGDNQRDKLNQQQQEHTKTQQQQQPKLLLEENTITREYSREAFSKTQVQTLSYPQGQHQPGYTVSTVPNEWKMAPKERQNSRVVEVVDTFIDRPIISSMDGQPPLLGKRYGGRVTLEEVLDDLFQSNINDLIPADPSNISESHSKFRNVDGPGIFTPNQDLMNKLAEKPELAEQMLRNEPIYVRCSNCQLIRLLSEAKNHYCWCRHCYTYYCSRNCRQRDWEKHRDRCSFARINSLCKEVIMKVRQDPETQFHMSRVAREGFRREGRGSVNIRLISAYSAQLYLEKGWKIFARHDPNQLLFYYPIQSLIDQRKEPSLIQLCRKYNPNEKFILSVSIIADVEQCPETPPPLEPTNNKNILREGGSSSGFGQEFIYGTAVPTNV